MLEYRDRSMASLAVLPFEEHGGQAADGYFARGFVEDLITELSRFPELLVLASQSARRLIGPSLGSSAPGDRVDYVLRGSLRRDPTRLRVTTQLVAPEDGAVVWADRFDAPLEGLFDIQDEITARVVGTLSGQIRARHLERTRRKPPPRLAAYDLWLQGMDELKQASPEADERARQQFVRALDADPGLARAHVGLSLSYFNEWSCQLWSRWDENESRAFEHARRALELDDADHLAHMVLGRVLLFRREFDRSEAHIERSFALNANDPDCLVQLAMSFAYLGRTEEGERAFERALRLNPYHDAWYYAFGGLVAFIQERFEQVIEWSQRAPLGITVDLPAHLAVAYHRTGNSTRARELVDLYLEQFREKILAGREAEPGEALRWLRHVNPYRDSACEERLVGGLREIGYDPEGPVRRAFESTPARRVFRRVGSVWQVSFDGHDVHLPHMKGLVDLARLLETPDSEVHCADLVGLAEARDAADPTVDRQAREAYAARISDLQEQLAEAERDHDTVRAERAREELDRLVDHLERETGMGGRPRQLRAPVERARSAVTWRIRSAIRKIGAAHPALGRHLEHSVQTGTRCAYTPETPQEWRT